MKSFKIANFRLFNEEGAKVNFKPITILTGTNSSGKSSFVKSMILMQNYFDAVMKEPAHNPAAVQLDFTDPRLKMSGFDEALNYACDRDCPIIFSMDASSNYAPFPFTLEYAFVASKVSKTKGELQSIKLFYSDELLVEAQNVNGRLAFTHIGVKGILLKAFTYFIKGKLFQQGMRFDENTDEIIGSISPSGEDISDWSKYNSIFYSKQRFNEINGGKGEADLAVAIKKYDENGILMYIPVMETLNGLTKPEAIEAIMGAPVYDESQFSEIKGKIISGYEKSDIVSFVDYFRSLEDEEFSSFFVKCQMDGTLFGGDYISNMLGGCLSAYYHHDDNYGFEVLNDIPDIQGSEFARICKFFLAWEMGISQKSDNFVELSKIYVGFGSDEYVLSCRCILASAYEDYLKNFLGEILISTSFRNMVTAGNSFTPVQRLYSFEDRSSFVNTVKRFCTLSNTILLNQKSEKEDKSDIFAFGYDGTVEYKPCTFIDKWLKEFGIASHLVVDDDNDGLGFKMFLQKEGSDRLVSIADQGHGITQLITILMQIECAIMSGKIEEARGFDAYEKSTIAHPSDTILTIEEPEVSLHPSMQSKLALMFEDASKFGINFIIETHSEYLVRKTQVIVSSMEDKSKNPFCIYYFCSDGISYELEYTNTGGFVRQFGPGFFDEARGLAMEVINNSNLITEE